MRVGGVVFMVIADSVLQKMVTRGIGKKGKYNATPMIMLGDNTHMSILCGDFYDFSLAILTNFYCQQ